MHLHVTSTQVNRDSRLKHKCTLKRIFNIRFIIFLNKVFQFQSSLGIKAIDELPQNLINLKNKKITKVSLRDLSPDTQDIVILFANIQDFKLAI